jgi:hypothetical protein
MALREICGTEREEGGGNGELEKGASWGSQVQRHAKYTGETQLHFINVKCHINDYMFRLLLFYLAIIRPKVNKCETN